MVRFGILGAGNIANRFAVSLGHERHATLVAASCRSRQKAVEFLSKVPCDADARAYGSYDDMLDDNNVDAIYLALPHSLHKEWACKALRAGKAVLCEKPASLSAHEMCEIAKTAHDTQTLFMEAMKPRFVPLYEQVIAALPKIGTVTRIETTLCNDMLGMVEGSNTYHMTPGPGAGVLLDCGIYCASWIAQLCPGELKLTSIEGVAKNGIDIYANAWFDHDAIQVQLECAFDRAKPRTCTIVGECGTIVVEELHRPQRATIRSNDGELVLDVPYHVDDFFGELHHFVELIEQGVPESNLMTLNDSIRCAQIIDDIREGFTTAPNVERL